MKERKRKKKNTRKQWEESMKNGDGEKNAQVVEWKLAKIYWRKLIVDSFDFRIMSDSRWDDREGGRIPWLGKARSTRDGCDVELWSQLLSGFSTWRRPGRERTRPLLAQRRRSVLLSWRRRRWPRGLRCRELLRRAGSSRTLCRCWRSWWRPEGCGRPRPGQRRPRALRGRPVPRSLVLVPALGRPGRRRTGRTERRICTWLLCSCRRKKRLENSYYSGWDRWQSNDAWPVGRLPFYSPDLTSPTQETARAPFHPIRPGFEPTLSYHLRVTFNTGCPPCIQGPCVFRFVRSRARVERTLPRPFARLDLDPRARKILVALFFDTR